MFNFNKIKVFSIITAVFLLTPMLVSAGVYFMESIDTDAKEIAVTKPCILDYPKRSCPDGKVPQRLCPSDSRFFQDCGCNTDVYKYDASSCTDNKTPSGTTCDGKYAGCACDAKYQYTTANCTNGKTLSGNTCDGKYDACGCATEYSKTCSTDNLIPVDANDSCDGKYKSCKCPASYGQCNGSGQAGGAPGSASCTEEDGTVKYASCKAEVNCEAPYYKDTEGNCVIWDDVAAVAKTCNDLVLITNDSSKKGNILIYSAINCGDKTITMQPGQNLVGRGYFASKGYSGTTDTEINKASKIIFNHSDLAKSSIYAEHNTMFSDLTIEEEDIYKFNETTYGTNGSNLKYGLINTSDKQNLVFNNIDLSYKARPLETTGTYWCKYAGVSATSRNSSVEFKGTNNIRINQSFTDEANMVSKGEFRAIQSIQINMKDDSKLKITSSGGNYSGSINLSDINLSGNAEINMNIKGININALDGSGSSSSYEGTATLKGNSKINILMSTTFSDANKYGAANLSGSYGLKIRTYDSSTVNMKILGTKNQYYWNGYGIWSGSPDLLKTYDNSVINMEVAGFALYAGVDLYGNSQMNILSSKEVALNGSTNYPITINDNATMRIIAEGGNETETKCVASGDIMINGSGRLFIKNNNNNTFGCYGTRLKLGGSSSKLYISKQSPINYYIYDNWKISSSSSYSTGYVSILSVANAEIIQSVKGDSTASALFKTTSTGGAYKYVSGQEYGKSDIPKNNSSGLTSLGFTKSTGSDYTSAVTTMNSELVKAEAVFSNFLN